jgi:hypothetical protein
MFFRDLDSSLKDGIVEDSTTIKPQVSFQIHSIWSLTNHPTIRRYVILDVRSVVDKRNKTDITGVAENLTNISSENQESRACV